MTEGTASLHLCWRWWCMPFKTLCMPVTLTHVHA